MMIFPLDIWDISLLLAMIAIFQLITSEMVSPRFGKLNLFVNRKKLKNVALLVSGLFLLIVAIQVIMLVLSS
jgi:hypothetical protein